MGENLLDTQLINSLAEFLEPTRILHGNAVTRAYDCDAYSVDRSKPSIVVLPKTTSEVSQIVQICVTLQVPFTARGAGTGLSGGAMPALGGIVISTKWLNQIFEIDSADGWAHVGAGVVNLKLNQMVKSLRLHFAPDPSSQSVSTIGGNIAENSGGPHTLKYGVTAPHVLAVKTVSPNGEIQQFGNVIPSLCGPDFTQIWVGSEGLLGIVTEAWVKLTPLPESVETISVFFPSIKNCSECVTEIIAEGIIPAALEMMDRQILIAVRAAFALDFPEDTQAMLIVECDGSKITAGSEIARVEAICKSNNSISIKRAADEVERAKLWIARKKGIGAMGRLAPTIVTHDGVIPPSKLPEMLEFVYEVAKQFDIGVANIFHAGDGNLHPCFYFDDRDPAQIESVVAAGKKIMLKCLELGGSLTGEHGIGIEKINMMNAMFTPNDMELQRKVKSIFNQSELCNPCKVIPDQKGCKEHVKRWRGSAN